MTTPSATVTEVDILRAAKEGFLARKRQLANEIDKAERGIDACNVKLADILKAPTKEPDDHSM